MWNLNDVVEIEPRAGHSYLIVFDDGTRAVVDLSEYLDRGPMFAPLKDPGTYPRTPLPFREGSGEGRNPRLPLPLSLPLPRGERGYGVASAFFRQATIAGGTIAWPNGADIAPETLYGKCRQAAEERKEK